jgi:mono/diheme cytochrome c family protein
LEVILFPRIRISMFSAKANHRRLILVILALTLTACGGLAGEPRIVATFPPVTPAPVEVGYPAAPPDIKLGAQIFAERCTRCHGLGGRGDGELIGDSEGQISQRPRDFTDPTTAARRTPLEWFNIITDGRIDNFMPPWRDSLSEVERWAVALYTYILSYTSESIAEGQALLEQNQALLDSLPPPAEWVNLKDADLLDTMAQEWSFIVGLGDAQKQSVAAYLRTLTLTNPEIIGQSNVQPAATEEVANGIIGAVSGQLTNGTPGGVLPTGLKAVLHSLDSQFNDQPYETDIAADGSFSFSDVSLQADRNYIVTVLYQGRTFASEFKAPDAGATSLQLPVNIYEITDDVTVIQITGWVVQVTAFEGALRIAQVISFSNSSDRAYSTDQLANDDRYASVQVKVPPGAQLLSVAPDDQRYIISEDGTAVIDTAPILPAEEHIVQVVYSLPYSGEIELQHPLGYGLQGPARLLVTPDTIEVSSALLAPLGPQALRDQTYQGYGATLTLTANDTLRYTLRGTISEGGAPARGEAIVTTNSLLPVLLILVGVIAITAAGFISLISRTKVKSVGSESQILMDGLIRQIAELDELYEAGDLDQAAYQKRRAKLKARLAALMDDR